MVELKKDNVILARHITPKDIKEGLNFFSQDEEYIQVGIWKYQKDKELLDHVHDQVIREVKRTYETLYVVKGTLEARIFDLKGNYVETLLVSQGDILILLESGHGYRVLENDTIVLEVKNGPYLGAEIDRHRLGE